MFCAPLFSFHRIQCLCNRRSIFSCLTKDLDDKQFVSVSGIISSLQIALLMIVSLVFMFHALYFPQRSGDP